MSKLLDAIKNSEVTGKELSIIASNAVNSFSRQTDMLREILDDEDAKFEFQKMCVAYVKSLATANQKEFWHDGRNEYSCCVAAAIVNDFDAFQKYANITTWDGAISYTVRSPREWSFKTSMTVDRAGEFAFYMSMEHRTLQQSFAELAFICLSEMFVEGGDDLMAFWTKRGCNTESWTRTPLI